MEPERTAVAIVWPIINEARGAGGDAAIGNERISPDLEHWVRIGIHRRFISALITIHHCRLSGLSSLGTANAEILIKVDKSAQRMTVSRDGEVLLTGWFLPGVLSFSLRHRAPDNTFRMEADSLSGRVGRRTHARIRYSSLR